MKDKIKILFAATILSNGLYKNSFRSGVYFAAYNIFQEMIKNPNFNITLHCSIDRLNDLHKYLKEYFPEYTFDVITDIPVNYITKIFFRLRNLKNKFKNNKNIIKKSFIQLILIPYSLLIKIMSYFYAKDINKRDFDAFFSPFQEPPNCIKNNNKIKKFMLLHDAIPVLFPNYENGSIGKHGWFTKITNSFSKDNFYFANSNATRSDFLKLYKNIDKDKFFVILHACGNSFRRCSVYEINQAKIKYNIPQDKKYVFSLCTIEPRKNLIRAVKTFIQFIDKHNIQDLYFVLGGGQWDRFMSILEKEINTCDKYKDKIIKTGYIDDRDLAPLYSGAEWFVYTSQYEGFGVPPLEAMTSGCPIITSNNSSIPEVVGDAGIMIDFDSDEQHIKAYEKYYFDNELKEYYRKKGLERAKLFSWGKTTSFICDKIIERLNNEQ